MENKDKETKENEIKKDEINGEVKKESSEKTRSKKIFNEIIEWIICFIIAYIIYLIVNYFFGTISCVRQTSMYPTAVEGERVTIQRSKIFKKDLNYGDIIIFEAPIDKVILKATDDVTAKFVTKNGIDAFTYYFMGIDKTEYIKRVIGLPGDHIEIKDDGFVYRNDEKLEESYVKEGYTPINGAYYDLIVPEGTIYVMGDNRAYSKDSRYFGCVPIEKVTGYVGIRIWPLNKIGNL